MTVVPLRTGPQPSVIKVETLSRQEMEVAFYATNYRQTFDEVMGGGDVLRMIAAVVQVVSDHGIERIRELAGLLDYANLHSDLVLLDRLMPDLPRRTAAQSNARCLRRLLCPKASALHSARLVEWWRDALHGTTAEAVAA